MRAYRSRDGRNGRLAVRRAGFAALAVGVGALAACDSILDVDLPGDVTEEDFFQPDQATVLVNSAVSEIECAYSDFIASDAAGKEDVMMRDTGWWGGSHEYRPDPVTSSCNASDQSRGWWTPLQSGRMMAEETYRLMDDVWPEEEIAGDREVLLAESALFTGVAYNLLGEHFCEVAVEGGPLMSPDETLAEGEGWLTSALGHIETTGDFAIPGGTSPSAEQTAHLLRARVRLARGDLAGAIEDAEQVEEGFVAYVTRDGGGTRTRWNKVYNSHQQEQINTVQPAVDWWDGPPNPATGEAWPDVIPFTGYHDLGILPDGRAVTDSGHGITTAEHTDAVPDPRVPVLDEGRTFNEHEVWRQQKYTSLGDDIALARWEEAWLILARAEGGQEAVDRVNEIRAHHGLPEATYVDPADEDQVRNLVLEEERRTLFLEGRWWSTKIQERLWFPRGSGQSKPPTSFGYLEGVRMVMPSVEYDVNANFDESDRATLCDPLERPAI